MNISPIGLFRRVPHKCQIQKNEFYMPLKIRETEDAVIKVPDLMLLNKGTDRKLELRGGFNTDPKYFLFKFYCLAVT